MSKKQPTYLHDLFDVYWDQSKHEGHSLFGSYSIQWHPNYKDCAYLYFAGVCERSPYASEYCILLDSKVKYTDLEKEVRRHHKDTIEWSKKRLSKFINSIKSVEPKKEALKNDIKKLQEARDSLESGGGWALDTQIREKIQELVRLG